MGYSSDEQMVRVDFFKPSGKWYTTEAVKWTGAYSSGYILDEFAKSLRDHFGPYHHRLSEFDAICIKPYHQHRHPIQLKAGSWNKK